MRELAHPCPPNTFDERDAVPAVRRALRVVPQHVRLAVQIDPKRPVVLGSVTHTVRAIGDGVDRITLDAADLTVHLVTCDETELAFEHHAEGVTVHLDTPLAHGESLTFCLEYEARPTLGLYFVEETETASPQVWTQGAMEDHHHWFPCFDAPEHMVTSEVLAVVPEGFVAVSNGVPVGVGQPTDEGWLRFDWRHDTPHALYLLTLVIDRVVEVRGDAGPVSLHHYVPAGREPDAEAIFARVPAMLDFFGEATGRPYPYPRYGHVFLRDFMWGGMENTTLTSLTDRVLVDAAHVEEEDVERLVAHELAHQWFGDLVAPRGWPEIWLNESFATYFEQLCMGALNGPDDLDRRMLRERDSYLEEVASRYARPVVTRNYSHPYVLFDRHAYEKGCLVLHTLRDQLGDDAFFRGVRAYVAKCAGHAAETAELRRCFEEASGRDLTDFFEQMVYGAGHPRVEVSWRYDAEAGLEVTLARKDETQQRLMVTLAWCVNGQVSTRRVRLSPGAQTLAMPVARRPQWAALDPRQACLVEVLEPHETDEVLRARLNPQTAPTMLRVRTARLLAKRGSARNTEALAETLVRDPELTVRLEAAKALGAHRTDAARDALAQAMTSAQHWRTQAAAAAAIGVGAGDSWIAPLSAQLQIEPRHRVRSALLTGLGKIGGTAAHATIREHLDVPSPRDCVAAAAISALAGSKDPSVCETLVEYAKAKQPRPVRQAALGAMVKLAKVEGVDHAMKRTLRETVEAAVSDPAFHIRWSAALALKTLASPGSQAALKRAHGAERFGILRRIYREAMGAATKKDAN